MLNGEPQAHDNKHSSVFNEYILQDRYICDNCFTKTHEIITDYDPTNLKKSLRGILDASVERTNAETIHHWSYAISEGVSTVCSECGGQEAVEWRVDDLSKQSRIGKTRSLFRRLTEIEDVRVGYSELFEA